MGKTSYARFLFLLQVSTYSILTSCASVAKFFDRSPLSAKSALSDASSDSLIIPKEKGLIWFPLTWKLRLDTTPFGKQSTSLETLSVRNLGMVLRNTKSKETSFIRLSLVDKSDTSFALLENKKDKDFAIFAAPEFFEVAEGDYEIAELQFTYVPTNSEKTVDLKFSLENPFQPGQGGKQPIKLVAKKSFVGAMPRFAVTSSFANRDGGLVSITEVEPIDKELTTLDLAFERAKLPYSDFAKVFPASPDLPRSRVFLSSLTRAEGAVAKIGLIVDLPCTLAGHLNLVWKRVGDEREYLHTINLSAAPECKTKQQLDTLVSVPMGDWLLRSVYIVDSNNKEPKFQTAALQEPSSAVIKKLALDRLDIALQTQHATSERELKRQVLVKLASSKAEFEKSTGGSVPLLYFGSFELAPMNNESNNKSEKVTFFWDTLFKRTYSLENIRKKFAAQNIYNAYTFEKMQHSREKGAVQATLKVSSAQADAAKLDPFISHFRKVTTEHVAKCLTIREEVDPLAAANGKAFVVGLKGSQGVTLKALQMQKEPETSSNEPQQFSWMEDCLKKRLLEYGFTKRLPASFQAEYEFRTD